MRTSSQKDLSVYDFDEDEQAVEEASGRYTAKIQLRLNPRTENSITKYEFLQAFSSGMSFKQADANAVLCLDLHELENDQGSRDTNIPEKNLVPCDEKAGLEEVMASSTSNDEHGQMCPDEIDDGRTKITDATLVGNTCIHLPSVDNKHFSDLSSEGTKADVISEDEDSWNSVSESLSTTSDVAENEEYPVTEDCYFRFENLSQEDADVVVYPIYVIYGCTLYEDSQLTFSTNCVKIECLDASGNDDKFVAELNSADISCIDCLWSESVEAALVKLCFRANSVSETEKHHNGSDLVKIMFSVDDMHWMEKVQKIKNLAARYKEIWNARSSDDLMWQDDAMSSSKFFSREYFTDISEPFEDVIYPKGDPDAVSISRRDIELLQPETFINDTIIDFYIKYLKDKIHPDQKHRFHFFNSFFFRKLVDLDKDRGNASEGRAAFLRVRKWTRKVNIFEKDYIFIPVNFNLHWSLLVICHPGEVTKLKDGDLKDSPKVPCILHMDSIKGSHSGLKTIIQSYISEEWKERQPESHDLDSSEFLNLRFVPLELPQQENSFDCGLFLLHYVEMFLEEAPLNFNPFKITKFSSFLSADWFLPAEASLKRCLIRKLIYELLKDPSQKVVPDNSSNGHLWGCMNTENDINPEPFSKLLPEQCSPAKQVMADTASYSMAQGDEPGEILRESAASVPSPEHMEHPNQNDSPDPAANYCLIVDRADRSEQLASSSIECNCLQSLDGHPTTEPCATSYSPKASVEEKDAYQHSTRDCPDHAVIDQSEETEKPAAASPDNSGFDPDSPTSSHQENIDGYVEDSPEIDASKSEVGDCEDHQNFDIIREDGEGRTDCSKIKIDEPVIAHSKDFQLPDTNEKGDHDVPKIECTEGVDECQNCLETSNVVAVSTDRDCQEISSDEARTQDCNYQERLLPQAAAQEIVITDVDESLDKDDVQFIDIRAEQPPSKRRKIIQMPGRISQRARGR